MLSISSSPNFSIELACYFMMDEQSSAGHVFSSKSCHHVFMVRLVVAAHNVAYMLKTRGPWVVVTLSKKSLVSKIKALTLQLCKITLRSIGFMRSLRKWKCIDVIDTYYFLNTFNNSAFGHFSWLLGLREWTSLLCELGHQLQSLFFY